MKTKIGGLFLGNRKTKDYRKIKTKHASNAMKIFKTKYVIWKKTYLRTDFSRGRDGSLPRGGQNDAKPKHIIFSTFSFP